MAEDDRRADAGVDVPATGAFQVACGHRADGSGGITAKRLRSTRAGLTLVVVVGICAGAAGLSSPDGARAQAATEAAAAVPLPPCLPIEVGETVDGTISPEYERDVYCLEARAGSRVTITMVREPGSGNSLDPRLHLLDPDAELVNDPAADDDRGGQRNALIANAVLPQGGTYRIVGTSYEGESAGAYTLSVRGATASAEQ